MIYILDACTVINCLHIDEDEFLLKKISLFRFFLCKSVFDEVNRNVFKKFNNTIPYPLQKHSLIENKLKYFREKIYSDESYCELEPEISPFLNYNKKNGEFYSVLLSLYLNIFNSSHVVLFTDDGPAKDFFASFFIHHRIGYIEDSVDLLIQLYRHNDNFTSNDLKKLLYNLYHEYSSELSSLQKELQEFQIPKNQIRNKPFKEKLSRLRNAVQKLNFDELLKLNTEIVNDSKKYPQLSDLLSKYSSFFNKKPNQELFHKVRESIDHVDKKPFFRM